MTGEERALRLFVAAELPSSATDALREALADLRARTMLPLRWVRPESIHLTLKFLGDVPPAQVPAVSGAVEQAVSAYAPLTLELSGFGAFPTRGSPRVVWTRLSGDVDGLEGLHRSVELAMSKLGFPPEDRPFAPHLTLARVGKALSSPERAKLAQALEGSDAGQGHTFRVEAVVLVQSTLLPAGAAYKELQRVPLETGVVPASADVAPTS